MLYVQTDIPAASGRNTFFRSIASPMVNLPEPSSLSSTSSVRSLNTCAISSFVIFVFFNSVLNLNMATAHLLILLVCVSYIDIIYAYELYVKMIIRICIFFYLLLVFIMLFFLLERRYILWELEQSWSCYCRNIT